MARRKRSRKPEEVEVQPTSVADHKGELAVLSRWWKENEPEEFPRVANKRGEWSKEITEL